MVTPDEDEWMRLLNHFQKHGTVDYKLETEEDAVKLLQITVAGLHHLRGLYNHLSEHHIYPKDINPLRL